MPEAAPRPSSGLLTDTLLSLLASGLLGVVLLVILRPAAPARRALADLPVVGTLERALGEVRRRADGTLVWDGVADGERLRQRDAVYVGRDGEARLRLSDGSRLTVAPSTLVILEQRPAQDALPSPPVEIELRKGQVLASAGAGAVTVRSGSSSLQVAAGGEAQVSTREGGTQVHVLRGTATLESAEQRVSLVAGEQGGVTRQGGVSAGAQSEVELLSPDRGRRLYTSTGETEVRLRWRPTTGEGPWIVQITGKGPRAEPPKELRTEALEVPVTLQAPGRYLWRVWPASSGPGVSSERRELVVVRERPPVPLRPEPSEVFENAAGRLSIVFAWAKAPDARAYQLQMAQDEGFTRLVAERTVASELYALERSYDEGRYWWRVRTHDERRPEAPWSAPSEFVVTRRSVPEAPELYEPELRLKPASGSKPNDRGAWLWRLIGSVAHAASPARASISLRWRPVAGVRTYRLEIAKDRRFRRVVLEQRVEGTAFQWPVLPQQRHYWRVTGVDADGHLGRPSPPGVIEPVLGAPEPTAPANGQRLLQSDAPPTVRLEWTSSPVADHYRVQVAADAAFRRVLAKREVRGGTSLDWHTPGPGDYHWRVQLVDLTGRATAFGGSRSIQVRLTAPRPQWPRSGARLHGGSGGLAVAWSKRQAERYEVQLSRQASFGRDARTLSTRETSVDLPRRLFGTLHWRVRAIDSEGRASAWSESSWLKLLLPAPAPLAPADGHHLGYREPPSKVLLRWRPSPGAASCKAEVARYDRPQSPAPPEAPLEAKSPADREVVSSAPHEGAEELDGAWREARSITSGRGGARLEGLPPGAYRWRVRCSDGKGSESPTSAVRWFRISVLPPLPPPDLEEPERGAELSGPARRLPLRLRWEPIEEATAYDVELWRTGLGELARTRLTAERARAELPSIRAGVHHWRVRAVDAEGAKGVWSQDWTFYHGPQRPGSAVVALTPEPALADGVTPAALTVRLEDRAGYAMPGARVLVAAPGARVHPPTDRGRGLYVARLVPARRDEPGELEVTVGVLSTRFQHSERVRVAPPEDAPWRKIPVDGWSAGPRLGVSSDLSGLWLPVVQVEGLWRPTWLPEPWGIALGLGYTWSTQPIGGADGELSGNAFLTRAIAELSLRYAHGVGPVGLYGELGAALWPTWTMARVSTQPEVRQRLTQVAGLLTAGIELPVGPGAAFVDLTWAEASSARDPVFELERRQVKLAGGYRVDLR